MENTPKMICVGRKPKEDDVNDYCRCCKASLKVCYGDSWKWVSSENLFLSSKKKGLEGTILSDTLHQKTGIVAETTSSLSTRLCQPCATKIRKTSEGLFIVLILLLPPPPPSPQTNPNPKPKSLLAGYNCSLTALFF